MPVLQSDSVLGQKRFYQIPNQNLAPGDNTNSYSEWSQPRHKKQPGTPFAEVRSAYKASPIPKDPFGGISSNPLSEEILAVLNTAPDPSEINIKRMDGALYITSDFYQHLLNKAVGPGGWSIVPISEPTFLENQEGVKVLIREFGLYMLGRFMSVGIGEAPWYLGTGLKSGIVNSYEIVKRDALTMCCKELGMAQSLYNERFIIDWREKYAEKKLCENMITKGTKSFWIKKGNFAAISPPWRLCSDFVSDINNNN